VKIERLCLFDEKVLRQKAEKIEKIDRQIVELARQMIETLVKNRGVGLSGNQVGAKKRIVVVDLRPCGYKVEPFALVNPEITDTNGTVVDEEGCLSFPEFFIQIERPAKVKVVAQNLAGEKVEIFADGLLTRILCHEIDHLNGVLFVDYADNGQKNMIREYISGFRKKRRKDPVAKAY